MSIFIAFIVFLAVMELFATLIVGIALCGWLIFVRCKKPSNDVPMTRRRAF